MRDIKFRGKRLDGVTWVHGDLVHDAFDGFDRNVPVGIRMRDTYPVEVDIDTVGQFTGLKDKNGNEIYEGDIVKEKDGSKSTIVFETHMEKGDLDIDTVIIGWVRKWNDGCISPIGFYEIPCFEIIGNIHQNPELIK